MPWVLKNRQTNIPGTLKTSAVFQVEVRFRNDGKTANGSGFQRDKE